MQHGLLTRTKEVFKEYQLAQLDFKTGVREKIGRQAKFLDPKLSDDQVSEIAADPEVSFE